MNEKKTKIYFKDSGNIEILKDKVISVLGYGNQGRAQSLNMRDSGLHVIIGNDEDRYKNEARKDGFRVFSLEEATEKGDVVFLLLPDEIIPELFSSAIVPHLKDIACICFASGYTVAFNLIKLPLTLDVILVAPRMIGIGVRESYLSGEGFFSFVSVEQDATGNAEEIMLGCAKAVGTLNKAAIRTTMKQEAVLDLYNEQAFGPAFGRVLLDSIDILIKNGMPEEAVLIEMYMSGEMSYTYKKMAQIGLVNQTNFHSHTSQYGAMSRGMRYLDLHLKEKFQKSFDEIESGRFAEEWQKKLSRLKFKVIKYFAMRQQINRIEERVRKNLRLKSFDLYSAPADIEKLLTHPEIRNELEKTIEGKEF